MECEPRSLQSAKGMCKISFMTQRNKDKHMEREGLGIKMLLTTYVDLYTMEKKETRWLPVQGPTGRSALRGTNLVTDETQVAAVCKHVINVLQANHGGLGGQSNSLRLGTTCYNCGQPDHLTRGCPEPRRSNRVATKDPMATTMVVETIKAIKAMGEIEE